MRLRFVQLCFLAAFCCTISGTARPQEPFASQVGNFTGEIWASESGTPASVGPFRLASPDSSSWLRFQFAGQLRVDFESRDQGGEKSRSNDLTMRARRLRPIISVDLPKQRLLFRLHLSAAPGSLELMDFYFNYKARPQLQIRYGQYKVPFTRYRMQSYQRLTFVDWAIVAKGFGAERQMGFALHNGYEKPPKYAYAVGVFSGVPARASQAVYLSKIYGEETLNPSDLANPGPRAKFHPELFLHLAYNARGIRVRSDTDEERGGLRYAAMFSAAWDLDPRPHHDLQLRLAPELLTKYRGLSFSAIGYAGFAELGAAARTEPVMLGGLFQTAYRVNNRYEISARYAVVDFRDAVTDDASEAARQFLPGAHERLRTLVYTRPAGGRSDDTAANSENPAQVLGEEEITIGFNTYLTGHTLKWQNELGWLRHRRRDDNRTDYVMRSQFQLTF